MRVRMRLAAVCLVIACACGVGAWAEQAQEVKLTILHTNDIHGHLFPFEYDALGKTELQVGGAARRATLIRQLEKSTSNPVLVMDAGDVFTRGPLADLLGVPDFDVMNAVPYDIMTLGNNEFKGADGLQGQKIMMERIKQAKFPVVCANVAYKDSGKEIVPPYHVFECSGLRIGVFGLTAPRVGQYAQAEGLAISDPIETAKRIVPELRKSCDFVVGLTHIGYPLDLQLASSVPDIDCIVGGDSHTWLFEPTLVKHERKDSASWWIGGTPVCQDGEWAKCVGKLDLVLRRMDSGGYAVASYVGKLVDVDAKIKPAADIQRILDEAAKPYMGKIGTLKESVSKADSAAWVAERMRVAAGAQVAIEPRGGVESGLPAGPVTELDVREMFPFVNGVVKLTVTGKQLAAYVPAADAGLAGMRVTDGVLYVGSAKVVDDSSYTLAIEDYYASNSPELAGARIEPLGKSTRTVVRDYIAGSR